jgi:hypothetical protein
MLEPDLPGVGCSWSLPSAIREWFAGSILAALALIAGRKLTKNFP